LAALTPSLKNTLRRAKPGLISVNIFRALPNWQNTLAMALKLTLQTRAFQIPKTKF
jgi:hypothetical protein